MSERTEALLVDDTHQPAPVRRGGELRALTGLRGVAAVNVMLSHYNAPGFTVIRLFEFHNPAVDLFFCLSAFTLCLSYRAGDTRDISWRDFAVARVARIYPLYLLTLILSVHLLYVASNRFQYYPPHHMLRDAVEQILLVSNWPILGHGVSWDLPAWSVSVEALCYVCLFYPLFVLSRPMSRIAFPWRLSAIVVLTFVAYLGAALLFNPGAQAWGMYRPTTLGPYLAPFIRGIAMFVAGWLVYESYRRKDSLSYAMAAGTDAISVAILMIAIASQMQTFNRQQSVMLFPFLILGLAVNARSLTARVLASPPVHFLGMISYSIYLLHLPIYAEFSDHGPAFFRQDDSRVWVVAMVTLGAASLSYWMVEAPARRVLRGLLSRRPAKPVA